MKLRPSATPKRTQIGIVSALGFAALFWGLSGLAQAEMSAPSEGQSCANPKPGFMEQIWGMVSSKDDACAFSMQEVKGVEDVAKLRKKLEECPSPPATLETNDALRLMLGNVLVKYRCASAEDIEFFEKYLGELNKRKAMPFAVHGEVAMILAHLYHQQGQVVRAHGHFEAAVTSLEISQKREPKAAKDTRVSEMIKQARENADALKPHLPPEPKKEEKPKEPETPAKPIKEFTIKPAEVTSQTTSADGAFGATAEAAKADSDFLKRWLTEASQRKELFSSQAQGKVESVDGVSVDALEAAKDPGQSQGLLPEEKELAQLEKLMAQAHEELRQIIKKKAPNTGRADIRAQVQSWGSGQWKKPEGTQGGKEAEAVARAGQEAVRASLPATNQAGLTLGAPKTTPFFEVDPPTRMLLSDESLSTFDRSKSAWLPQAESFKAMKEVPEIYGSRIWVKSLPGRIDPKTLTLKLPVQHGMMVDPRSIRFNGAKVSGFSVWKGDRGSVMLRLDGVTGDVSKLQVAYEQGGSKAADTGALPADSESMGAVPAELLAKTDPLINGLKTNEEKAIALEAFFNDSTKHAGYLDVGKDPKRDARVLGLMKQAGNDANRRIQALTQAFLDPSLGVHCDYSTELYPAVARHYGIPTRKLIGFSNQEEEDKTLSANEGHAWAKVYSPERGTWIEVNPTPRGELSEEQKLRLKKAEHLKRIAELNQKLDRLKPKKDHPLFEAMYEAEKRVKEEAEITKAIEVLGAQASLVRARAAPPDKRTPEEVKTLEAWNKLKSNVIAHIQNTALSTQPEKASQELRSQMALFEALTNVDPYELGPIKTLLEERERAIGKPNLMYRLVASGQNHDLLLAGTRLYSRDRKSLIYKDLGCDIKELGKIFNRQNGEGMIDPEAKHFAFLMVEPSGKIISVYDCKPVLGAKGFTENVYIQRFAPKMEDMVFRDHKTKKREIFGKTYDWNGYDNITYFGQVKKDPETHSFRVGGSFRFRKVCKVSGYRGHKTKGWYVVAPALGACHPRPF